MEHQIEEKLAKSTQTQKEWRLKQVSTSTWAKICVRLLFLLDIVPSVF
jgi:hypothetical protein